MTLLRRRIRDDRDLFVMNEWVDRASQLPSEEFDAIVEAVEAAEERIRRKGLTSLSVFSEAVEAAEERIRRKGPAIYSHTHGGYRVVVMDAEPGPCVLMVLELQWVDVAPKPDPDDRCSSCQRWSGHEHADWCSTRCTCPDDATRHLPDCGKPREEGEVDPLHAIIGLGVVLVLCMVLAIVSSGKFEEQAERACEPYGGLTKVLWDESLAVCEDGRTIEP